MDRYRIVKSCVDAWDPYGLLAGGAPGDEYDSESRRIAERITENASAQEIASVMEEVMDDSFGYAPHAAREAAEQLKGLLMK